MTVLGGCLQGATETLAVLAAALDAMLMPRPITMSARGTFDGGDGGGGNCELIGTFSLLTQACLGLLCLSSLIVKRSYEYPVRRSWSVWFFDVSKQLIGALGVHIFNVVLSVIKTRRAGNLAGLDDGYSSDDPVDDDACDWYFLNIVFDCTIGVYILYLAFRLINKICAEWLMMTGIKSGEYGPDPNKPHFRAYFKQLAIYFTSLMLTKCILFFVMNLFEKPLLWITSNVLLKWLDEFPEEFEIFMVIFVIPIFLNCLQLVLVDNFIKNPYFVSRRHSSVPAGDEEADANKTYGTFPEDE